jgi:DNA recombination protein RmuC
MQLAALLLLACIFALLVVSLVRGPRGSDAKLLTKFDEIEGAQCRHEQYLRDEFAQSRNDYNIGAKQNREELSGSFGKLSESMQSRLTEGLDGERKQLETFSGQLLALAQVVESKLNSLRSGVDDRLSGVTTEVQTSGVTLRSELSARFKTFADDIASRLSQGAELQTQQLDTNSSATRNALSELRASVDARLLTIQNDNVSKIGQIQTDVSTRLDSATATLGGAVEALGKTLREQSELLRTSVDSKLSTIQNDSTAKLEQIRATVDEKLQSTLQQRLGDSFKLVSERLEQVHAGLGEMRALASGVGDLKKVLANIKTRGNWGEVQLESLLEQMLAPEQYGKNVQTNPDSGERVEFAVRLPGRDGDGNPLWLPIDAKFPQHDYDLLIDASERGDIEAVANASHALDATVLAEAKKIRAKYISPPHTTDFAILFVPTEGLFAELLRKPELCDRMRVEKIVLAGPTTLAALLSSLQLGFRTLAIEKRSAEVWCVLGAVKTEFEKFGNVLRQVDKKLHEASNKIGEVQTRSRALTRKLHDVQGLPETDTAAVLGLEAVVPPDKSVDEAMEEELVDVGS